MKRKPSAAIITSSAALFFSLGGAPAASAAVLLNGTTGQPIAAQFARWVAESKTPPPAGQISVYPDADIAVACDGQAAAACSEPGQIWISGGGWRVGFEHELGHQWDFQHMPPNPLASPARPLERWQQFFEQMWGLTGDGWWTPFSPSTGAGPGEWFAIAYQLCATDGPGVRGSQVWEDDFDFPGYDRPWAMGATCALIRDVNVHPENWELATSPG